MMPWLTAISAFKREKVISVVYEYAHFTQGQKYLVTYCSKCKPFTLLTLAKDMGEGKLSTLKDVLLFPVGDDNVKYHGINRERKSHIQHQLQLFFECQMAVALNLPDFN